MLLEAGRTVARLERGTHACLLYEEHEDPIALAAPFLAAGLAGGERCVFVLGALDEDAARAGLAAAGIDVEAECERDALRFIARWDFLATDGGFDARSLVAFVRDGIAEAVAHGFTGLRAAVEMTWTLESGLRSDETMYYEALGDELYADHPLVAICMYDRSRFPVEVCRDAVRGHPYLVMGGELYTNLYYEPPTALASTASAADQLERMLAQVRRMREAEDRRLQQARERDALQEAERRIRERDAFISTAAHELRQPITAVHGYATLLRRRLEREMGDLSRLDEIAVTIQHETDRLGDMLDRLLDTNRAGDGRLVIEPVPVDLVEIASQAVARTRMSTGAPVELDAAREVIATVDPLRIEQVLTNLLQNAVKHGASDAPIRVAVGLPEDGWACIEVRDHGDGIAPEHREHIFARYYQAQPDRGGLGVGLYISREIARLHGGDLVLDCPEDGGACFTVRLPL